MTIDFVAFAATLMSDAYDVRPAGSLKLKGTVTDGGIVKKQVFYLSVYLSTNRFAGRRKSPRRQTPTRKRIVNGKE